MSYTITATDFDRLANTCMGWKGHDWELLADRFETNGDSLQRINWDLKKIYWIGKEYASVIFAKMFLTSRESEYQILWDLGGCQDGEWVVITDYYSKDEVGEQTPLMERRQKRVTSWELHKEWLDASVLRKGKGSVIRKKFYAFLRIGMDKVFENEEDEYQYIKKFGRGAWTFAVAFTTEEQEKIVDIAKAYGAFDY